MMFNKSLIKTALKETRQNFLWITTVFLYFYIFFAPIAQPLLWSMLLQLLAAVASS